MYWVIQENIYNEEGMNDLITCLERRELPHSIHKVVPFIGELQPDINPVGKVMVMGAYSMRHIAKKKGWVPGVFDIYDQDFLVQKKNWGSLLLNHDGVVSEFGKAIIPDELAFVRPVNDSKYFAGGLFEPEEFKEWQDKVVRMKEDTGSSLVHDTMVMVCTPKRILKEFRFWIINGKIVTSSVYKVGNRILYNSVVDENATNFVLMITTVLKWNPSAAYVLDVCQIEDETYRIVEINTLNSAGLYAADVGKLVDALEFSFDTI